MKTLDKPKGRGESAKTLRVPQDDKPAAAAAASACARDVRVDRIGYVQDLERLWAKPLKDKLKERMVADGLLAVEAERYEGKMFASSSASISAERFFKLFQEKRITREDFLAAISVSRERAGEFLSPRDLEAISDRSDGTPRLTIVRKKGIDVPLAEAVAAVANALGAGLE